MRKYHSEMVEDIMDELRSGDWAKLVRVWLNSENNES